MKKFLVNATAASVLFAPVTAVVACGESSDESVAGLTDIDVLKDNVSNPADYWFVTDQGSVSDKSFNQSGLDGVYTAAQANDRTYNYAQSKDLGGIQQGYDEAIKGEAKVVVGAGYEHGYSGAVDTFATDGDIAFIGLDAEFSAGTEETYSSIDNLVSINYNSQYAGFAAGLFAIYQIETNQDSFDADANGDYHVATYGGDTFPTVTNWMDGFQYAIDTFGAKDKHGGSESTLTTETDGAVNVKMVYADGDSASTADFSGGFGLTDDNSGHATEATQITQIYLEAGADIIFPVAGPQIQLTIEEIMIQGSNAKVIGVDSDQSVALASQYQPYVLGSALKMIKDDVVDVLNKWETKDETGTANEWDDIAGKNIVGTQGFIDCNGNSFSAGLKDFVAVESLYESTLNLVSPEYGFGKAASGTSEPNWSKIEPSDIVL